MATTNFKTYKAENRYKREPLKTSKLKSLDELLNEAKAVKEKQAQAKQYEQDALMAEETAKQQEIVAQQETTKPKKNVGATIRETFGRFGEGIGKGLESFGDSLINSAAFFAQSKAPLNLGTSQSVPTNYSNYPGGLSNKEDTEPNQSEILESAQKIDESWDTGANFEASSKAYADKNDQASYLKGLGQEAVVGIGNMLPSIAVGALASGAGGLMTMGMQVLGGSSEAAYDKEATTNQAFGYGLLSATKEVATELLIGGGLGKLTGYTGLLDKAVGKLAKNAIWKFGIEALGEGVEEVAAELLDPILKSITYDKGAIKDYNFSNSEYWSGVLEAGLVGSITGAIFNGANLVVQKATKADVTEVLEQYDKVSGLEQAYTTQNKMTPKNKEYIADLKAQLVSQLQKKMNGLSPTARMNYLAKYGDHALLKDYNGLASSEKVGLSKIQPSVNNDTQNSQKRNQDEIKAQETQAVMDSVNQIHKQITEAYKTDTKLVWEKGLKENINGWYDKKTKTMHLNQNAKNPVQQVFRHEMTHSLEGTKYYQELQKTSIEFLKKTNEYDSIVKTISEDYADLMKDMSDKEKADYISEEVMGKFSERLFSDQKSIDELVKTHKNLATRIYEWIKRTLKTLKDGKEKTELQKIETMYKKALESVAKEPTQTNYEQQKLFSKTKFSLNSKNEKLTNEQQEFFKDSQVRDEQGRLQVVYHGSQNEAITSFQIGVSRNTQTYENLIYFTNQKNVAEEFAKGQKIPSDKKGKVYNAYINLKKPLDTTKLSNADIENIGNIAYDSAIDNKSTVEDADQLRKEAVRDATKLKNAFEEGTRFNGQALKPYLEGKMLPKYGYDGLISFMKTNKDSIIEYGVLESNQIKETTNLNPSESDDIRYSKTKETKYQETLLEATKDYLSQETQDRLKTEKSLSETTTNRSLVDQVNDYLVGKDIKHETELMVEKLTNTQPTDYDTTLAERLIQKADSEGLHAEATDLTLIISQRLNEQGKAIQAASIVQRLSSEGELMWVRKGVAKYNEKVMNKKNYANKGLYKEVVKERSGRWLEKDLTLDKLKTVETFVKAHPEVDLTSPERVRLTSLVPESQNYTENVKEVIGKHITDKAKVTELAKELTDSIKARKKEITDSYQNDPVVIPTVLQEALIKSKTEASKKEAVNAIEKEMKNQRTASFYDVINAWRYLAMLGNVKTHLRNIVSNTVMGKVVSVKNAVARAIETIAIHDSTKRTRTFKKPGFRVTELCQEQAVKVKEALSSQNKYQEAGIEQRTFKNRLLEQARKFNFLALKAEDNWAFVPRFTKELAEWSTAKGYSAEFLKSHNSVLEEGSLWATEQALKATFNDTCKAVTALNFVKASNKLMKIVMDAVVPFTKTPVNIARRAFEYSPIGFVKSITYGIYQLKSGKINANQFIDNISAGFVGSGVTLVGYILASLGVISGGDDENKKVSNYEKALGTQAYSVKIGDATYTLDWLAPSSIPFFMGVQIYEGYKSQETDVDPLSIIGTVLGALDPMTEMSFVRGLNSAMSSYDGNKIVGFMTSAMQSYVSQFLPTLGSQIAKTVDDTRRTTSATGSDYTKKMETIWNYLTAKVPFFASKLEPYVNVWGEEEKDPSWESRLMENFIYPFYISENKADNPVDKEIARLYQAYGNTDVMPSIPTSYYTLDGERVDMTDEEYTQYKKDTGRFSYSQLQNLFSSPIYMNMTDEEKEIAIKKVYDYSRDYAKKQDKYLVYNALGTKSAFLSKYLIEMNSLEGTKDGMGNTISGTKKKAVETYINAQRLSSEQKHILFALAGYSNTSDKEQVYAYVNSLNLTDEQKKQLWELCKYN